LNVFEKNGSTSSGLQLYQKITASKVLLSLLKNWGFVKKKFGALVELKFTGTFLKRGG